MCRRTRPKATPIFIKICCRGGIGIRPTSAKGISPKPKPDFIDNQVSRKLRSLRERLGCFSLRKAFASI
jgi:hypothetical protein